MCGLTGIVNKNFKEIDKTWLKYANDLIAHRGPDSMGAFSFKNVGLAHRRLSILDLSDLGHQPMHYLNRYVITYNGEIYNFLELKQELILLGYEFVSNCDTEVIMAAYDAWNKDCLNKFNGMWSFAILDKSKNEIFLARDRFGVKPLYYRENEDNFIFGSEIKQLLNKTGNVVNAEILLESMLTHVDNHTQATYFKDVYCFPQGHFMIYNIDTNERTLQKYYELTVTKKYEHASEHELTQIFNDLLRDAIELRLRSDVKVGTCLSGGLDSSAISIIAASKYNLQSGENFVAINAKSTDQSNDESHYAKIVAEEGNMNLNVVTPSYDDFLSTIDEVIYTQEEPFGSPSMFMGWQVFKRAKELGCSVMLNGQGGDEILLGYERYFSATLSFKRPLEFAKQLVNQAFNSRLTILKTLAYFFYFRNSKMRINRLVKKSFVKKDFIKARHFETVKESAESFSNIGELQMYEITKFQLPHLLRYEDRNSMRHSIETRLPFLDYRLVEFAISLPLKYKIQHGWTKYILRKAVSSILPDSIVWRKNKFGFEAPERNWLNNNEKSMKEQIQSSSLINHFCDAKQLVENYDKVSLKDKWMYFNISRWEKIYNVVLE